MSPGRTVLAALALTAFLACESVLEPEVSVDVSSLAFSDGGDQEFQFDMLDDLAVEKTDASGSGEAEVDDGALEVEVEAEGLIPGDDYELNVTIDFASVVTFGPVTADEDGEVEFEGDIPLAPGEYRLDFFVTHTAPTGTGVVFGLLDRDLLLRCAPAVFVTIEADDD